MQRRSAITLAVVLLAALLLTATATQAHDRANLNATLTVTDYTVSNDSLTGVTVRVTNHEPTAKTVLVRVWGLRDHRQHMWAAPDGQQQFRIPPGGTRTLRVQRQQFNLSTKPRHPVMIAVTTPHGVERTHAIIHPRPNASP